MLLRILIIRTYIAYPTKGHTALFFCSFSLRFTFFFFCSFRFFSLLAEHAGMSCLSYPVRWTWDCIVYSTLASCTIKLKMRISLCGVPGSFCYHRACNSPWWEWRMETDTGCAGYRRAERTVLMWRTHTPRFLYVSTRERKWWNERTNGTGFVYESFVQY